MSKCLRILLLCAVLSCPLLLSSGCGTVADEALPLDQDTTLNPETDSTMNVL